MKDAETFLVVMTFVYWMGIVPASIGIYVGQGAVAGLVWLFGLSLGVPGALMALVIAIRLIVGALNFAFGNMRQPPHQRVIYGVG